MPSLQGRKVHRDDDPHWEVRARMQPLPGHRNHLENGSSHQRIELKNSTQANVAAVAKIMEEHPNWGARKIARKLGAKPSTVQHWMAQLETPDEEPTLESDIQAAGNMAWNDRYGSLSKKYSELLKKVSATELLVSEIKSMAPTSYSPAPAVIRDRKRRDVVNSPQSAVLLFSDTHVGQVIEPEQTLGHGHYNFDIFLNRLKYLEESVISIYEDHHLKSHDCPELVVCMLGDMLHGALGHSNEADQIHTRFAQYFGAGHAIAQFFRNLAAHFPKVRIHTAVGNHTRWESQKKMPTVNRFSNLDMFAYALIQALVKDIPNIEFNLNKQPFTEFEVQGFRFHGMHGDSIRGGDKALGIPNHSIGRKISATTQLAAVAGTGAPHYYGGFPGVDNFAVSEGFTPVKPSQRFFFVHPKYGASASYPINLNFASDLGKRPYVIPEGFI
jgi:hypothetical protein